MFWKYITAAVGFVGAMLLASVLQIVVGNNLLPYLKGPLGTSNPIYWSVAGVVKWLPAIAFVAILFGLVARSVTESRLPG